MSRTQFNEKHFVHQAQATIMGLSTDKQAFQARLIACSTFQMLTTLIINKDSMHR